MIERVVARPGHPGHMTFRWPVDTPEADVDAALADWLAANPEWEHAS